MSVFTSGLPTRITGGENTRFSSFCAGKSLAERRAASMGQPASGEHGPPVDWFCTPFTLAGRMCPPRRGMLASGMLDAPTAASSALVAYDACGSDFREDVARRDRSIKSRCVAMTAL